MVLFEMTPVTLFPYQEANVMDFNSFAAALMSLYRVVIVSSASCSVMADASPLLPFLFLLRLRSSLHFLCGGTNRLHGTDDSMARWSLNPEHYFAPVLS